MENSKSFKLLEKQLEKNITSWYPFEESINYKIIKDFTKNKQLELEEISKSIRDNDIIILMLNNRLGVNNVCENISDKEVLYNKQEIEDFLDRLGLKFRKFYYPLPNYNMPNVIFTDAHLPNTETINRNLIFYKETSIKMNSQNDIFKEIIKVDKNLFKTFANSFFIECSKKELKDNEIEFVSYSNIRKEEYQIQTIIKNDVVFKTNSNENSRKHIKNIMRNIDIMNQKNINTLDSYDEKCVISDYKRNENTFEEYIINESNKGNVEYVKKLIHELLEELKQKLEIVEEDKNVFDKYNIEYIYENIENLNFVKYGLWDLIFQNSFFLDGKFYFYDQEWLENNIPIEFIMYRSYKYSLGIKKVLPEKEFYEIVGIQDKNIKLFDNLDIFLQKMIRDENNWKIHAYPNTYDKIIEQINLQKEQMNKEALQLLKQKDAYISKLEDDIRNQGILINDFEKQILEKDAKIQYMENSRIWKIRNKLKGDK